MSSFKLIKIAFRAGLVTALLTMLGFALGGLIGILSLGITRIAGITVNLQNALWFGAIPGGVLGMVAGAVIITVSEMRSRRSC